MANQHGPNQITPDQDLLKALFHFDQTTGRLFWKPRSREMCATYCAFRTWNAAYAGKEALTYRNSNGYKKGTIYQKLYYAHRIIWKLIHGYDADFVDHANGDRSDNRPENLRNVSSSQNARNRAIGTNNKSGRIGVRYVKRENKWVAGIGVNGRKIYLGSCNTLEEACSLRLAAEKAYGYFPEHGRR